MPRPGTWKAARAFKNATSSVNMNGKPQGKRKYKGVLKKGILAAEVEAWGKKSQTKN